MLKQNLQQKLLQKLSPQQIQFIKLLQVPTVSLDTRIKEELEENPALEDLSLTNMAEPEEQYPDRDPDEDTYNSDDDMGSSDEFNIDDGSIDFDVVTELVFPDRAAYLAWGATLSGAGDQVATDEARFLDRPRTRAFVVEEHVSAG